MHNTPQVIMQGTITKACAQQLNLHVSLFLSTSLYDCEKRLLPNDLIMIVNYEEKLGDGQGHHLRSNQDRGPPHIKYEYTPESRSFTH